MRYEPPAIESRFAVRAELGPVISGTLQPVWRTPGRDRGDDHDGE